MVLADVATGSVWETEEEQASQTSCCMIRRDSRPRTAQADRWVDDPGLHRQTGGWTLQALRRCVDAVTRLKHSMADKQEPLPKEALPPMHCCIRRNHFV